MRYLLNYFQETAVFGFGRRLNNNPKYVLLHWLHAVFNAKLILNKPQLGVDPTLLTGGIEGSYKEAKTIVRDKQTRQKYEITIKKID